MLKRSALTFALITLFAGTAQAKISAAAGFEGWNDDDRPGHAVLLLAWDKALKNGKSMSATYNTDTLQFNYDGAKVGAKSRAYFELKGQAFIAGLLRDHFIDGKSSLDRAFNASYVQSRLGVKIHSSTRTWMEFELGGRRWFFSKIDESADDLALPAEAWVLEPRLRFTFWDIADNRTIRDKHRFFRRVRGFAAGFELGVDFRSDDREWGVPDDERNRPETAITRFRQWSQGGWQIADSTRIQFNQASGLGLGEDDLTRERIGGMNPYVVSVPGAPWSAWLSEEYVGGTVSARIGSKTLEAGPVVGAIALRDVHRNASTDLGFQYGAGALLDWAIGDSMQLDMRAGYSPSLASDSGEAAWSGWLSFGWATE